MNTTEPTAEAAASTLAHINALMSAGRRNSRWYAGYLLILGVASIGLSIGVGRTAGQPLFFVVMAVWIVLIVALSLAFLRARSAMKGLGQLHGVIMSIWGAIWAITVSVGSFVIDGRPLWWWTLGGLAMLVPTVIGALIVWRRTA